MNECREREQAHGTEATSGASQESEGSKLPWSLTVGCLSASVVVICVSIAAALYVEPKPNSDLEWWQTDVIYQIYPRSFKDSNQDGIGDIPGITSSLDYLKGLGVGAIWLNPIYPSPQVDFGYDITDHCDIDAMYGTRDDLLDLISRAHDKDVKVILDFIPNHTSDQHVWFQRSRRWKQGVNGATEENTVYKDFFVWNSGKKMTINGSNSSTNAPPNNWMSAFGGSAWTWDEERQEFYFHQFSAQQPDLNYRNPTVIQKMNDVLSFWIENGVDGFRVDASDFLVESSDQNVDEPLIDGDRRPIQNQVKFADLNHIHTQHQSETHQIFRTWRRTLTDYEKKTGKRIFLIGETFDETPSMNWWKDFYANGADMPFNFYLMERTDRFCDGHCFKRVIGNLLNNLPPGRWLNWVMGSHDQKRISTKYGCRLVNVMNMVNLLLPGTAITYQGEEIAMEDITLSYEETKDPLGKAAGPADYMSISRDGCRSPMQWTSERNGGFSSGESSTWIPLHPNYPINNVQLQLQDSMSTLWQYRRLVVLRRSPAFRWGRIELTLSTDQVFSFLRYARGKKYSRYLVIVNIGRARSTKNDYTSPAAAGRHTGIPKMGRVAFFAPSGACDSSELRREPTFFEGQSVNLEEISLDSGEGLVVEF